MTVKFLSVLVAIKLLPDLAMRSAPNPPDHGMTPYLTGITIGNIRAMIFGNFPFVSPQYSKQKRFVKVYQIN